MTRAEAIELAVRRHAAQGGSLGQIACGSSLGQIGVNAIRAHFRAICRTYGVVQDRTPKIAAAMFGRSQALDVVCDMPEYDGHSLRH